MIDYNTPNYTHELYNEFINWLGVTNSIDTNYNMINTSLFSSEKYIEDMTNTSIRLKYLEEEYKDNSSKPISKLLDVYDLSGNRLLPLTKYLSNSGLNTYNGFVNLDNKYIKYYTGYIFKVSNNYITNISDNNTNYTELIKPIVKINTTPILNPYYTEEDSINLSIYGNNGYEVLVNDLSVGIIEDNGVLNINIDITMYYNKYTIKFKYNDIESNSIDFIVIKSKANNTYKSYLLDYTRIINSSIAKIVVFSNIGANIKILGSNKSIIKEYTTVDYIDTVYFTISNINNINIIYVLINDIEFMINIDYSINYSNILINKINNYYTANVYLPDDLKLAMFKLAKHFYDGTLYSNSNVDSFTLQNGVKTSYISHTIPKDILTIIAKYTHFN